MGMRSTPRKAKPKAGPFGDLNDSFARSIVSSADEDTDEDEVHPWEYALVIIFGLVIARLAFIAVLAPHGE